MEKCPVCKGDKYIQEFDSRGLRQYQCRKCGGTGEVDKAKEDFETIAKNMGYSVVKVDGNYLNPNVTVLGNGYLAGRNSRDEEINDRKLECIDYQETIIKQQAEIKKLREALETIRLCAYEDNISRIAEKVLKGIT